LHSAYTISDNFLCLQPGKLICHCYLVVIVLAWAASGPGFKSKFGQSVVNKCGLI